MDEWTQSEVDGYLRAVQATPDAIAREMESLAEERRFPIVGPLVGRLLAQLVHVIAARRVLELGSGYGYSALHVARALPPDGELHCTELSDENAQLAESFLTRAGVWSKIRWHREEARAALGRVGGGWDLIFNDIDKDAYPDTIESVWHSLRPGGLFVTDNVLWHGRVLPGHDDGSQETSAVKEFTRRLLAHPGFETTILPLRDGLALALRL